jgi:prepilin-type N-terminal cleavage/methylation domain-containing protein
MEEAIYIRLRRPSEDAGFSLIEVATAMVLFGIMCAILVGPWIKHHHAQQHAGATRTVVAAMRAAQAASVAENATYRVDFTTGSTKLYRRTATTPYTLVRTVEVEDSSVTLSGASFVDSGGATSSSVYFYPRGSASKGQLTVGRSGSAKTYTITVEGLTARVSYA